MDEPQDDEDDHEDEGEPPDALANVGRADEQALHEEREGDEQDEVEDDALDRVIGLGGHVGVRLCLEAPGAAGLGDEGVVVAALEGLVRVDERIARAVVQPELALLALLAFLGEVGEHGIADPVLVELPQPVLVQHPHVPRHAVRRVQQRAPVHHVALAACRVQVHIQVHLRVFGWDRDGLALEVA